MPVRVPPKNAVLVIIVVLVFLALLHEEERHRGGRPLSPGGGHGGRGWNSTLAESRAAPAASAALPPGSADRESASFLPGAS